MLKIFTSYTPGAGKTYLMVSKAIEENRKGRKVVIGFLNAGHRDIGKTLSDNRINHFDKKGMNYDQIISLNPDVVVLDEMGMKIRRGGFVYDRVKKLMDAGIDVYTSANLKRFSGLSERFKAVTGITAKTTIPDEFLENAQEIYFIDRDPEKMAKDFEEGKLFNDKYKDSRIMKKNFEMNTLVQYRQVALECLRGYKNVKIVKRD